jgi:hypothetical protein
MGSECGLVWMIVVSTIDAHFPVSQQGIVQSSEAQTKNYCSTQLKITVLSGNVQIMSHIPVVNMK